MALNITSPGAAAISATATSTGALGSLTCDGININLFPGTEVEGGPTQVYLRRRDPAGIISTPLIGPGAPGRLRAGDGFVVDGAWEGVEYSVALELAADATAWFWKVALRNTGVEAEFDLILAQDVSISPYGMIRNNEYYVCQYLDNTALEHADKGYVVAVRNNLGVAKKIPWAVLGSLGKGVAYTTDALIFHGLALRNGDPSPGLIADKLPSQRFQHEHNLVAVQDEAFTLGTDEATTKGFFGLFVADHPTATAPEDVSAVDSALALPEAATTIELAEPGTPVSSLFTSAAKFAARDLSADEVAAHWGADLRQVETHEGKLEAFFTPGGNHVVLKAKERRVLRPHGHMLRTGDNLVPDESQLTNTTYMNGFFATQLAEGHVGVNKITTTARSYLGLQKAGGLRIFVEVDGAWQLLDQPSAYEVSINSASWIYATDDLKVVIVESALTASPKITLQVSTIGRAARFLLVTQVATSADESGKVPANFEADEAGITIYAPEGSGLGSFRFDIDTAVNVADDGVLFSDGESREQPFVTAATGEVDSFLVTMAGNLIPKADLEAAEAAILRIAPASTEGEYVKALMNGLDMAGADDPDISRLGTSLPWYVHNALIHYLSPRGLEQYNGGGWGTRDISQGPVELLLGLDHHAPIKDMLRLVFVAQNAHGGWPQAFGFFARNMFRHADDDPHGDVVFWPPLALAEYIKASGDVAFLDEEVGFYVKDGQPQAGTMLEHVRRAIDYINERLIAGTKLESYGHGDWNDSLQPADHSMTDTLVSSWTVTLHYQMLRALSGALALAGQDELSAEYAAEAEAVLADFQKWLIVDDVLAGYASFKDPENVTYLVHPSDDRTPLTYSILPIIHALINDMLTPEQAVAHKAILEQYLVAPDGGRLFDSPPKYQGGPQVFFQRAESSTFFGREIGIMYTHAHLRYAESMARYGDAEAFFLALRQAIPLGFTEAVPNGRVRQSNCYFSSSDAAFTDRYQASAEYDRVKDGTIDVEGGWRVYSSGAGIAVRLIHECLLGIKRGKDVTVIDPVMPAKLDGARVGLNIAGRPATFVYKVSGAGCGVSSVTVNGSPIATTALSNPYRAAGVSVSTAEIVAALGGTDDEIVVTVGG